jgi:effector-binding domain-containing protein
MTEVQKYRVLSDISGIQIRLYEPCVLAEISMEGEPNRVGNMAFGPLIGYISKNSISMTSPVLQEPATTAQGEATGDWLVSFVMPAGANVHDLPIPQDSRVNLRELPEHMAAVITWSGSWKYSEVEKRIESLKRAIIENGYSVAGQPQWARYDPPWKPWFLRRNEIIIPITG